VARSRRRSLFAFIGVMSAGLIAASLVTGAAGAAPRAKSHPAVRAAGGQSNAKVTFVGTTNARQLGQAGGAGGSFGSTDPASELGPDHELERSVVHAGNGGIPVPSQSPVGSRPNYDGWEGIDHVDQRFVAGNGNQFSLEPPDQGLCGGTTTSPNGPADGVEVMEAVNDAISFYDSTSHQFLRPISLSEFFGLPPTINRTTGEFGPFLSDPKCYFDVETGRWFVTMLEIGQDPVTGAFTNEANTYLAVSASSEMLDGYYIYTIDALDEDHAGCPCFGDQPLIGADQYGFYVNTSEYALDCFTGGGCAFNGPQIYAIDKAALEAGSATPNAVHFSGITHTLNGRTTGTVQPATTPSGVYDTSAGGTEYFLSGYDCVPVPGCPVAGGAFSGITIWAITNTSSLPGSPALTLSLKDLNTSSYATPVAQNQKDGPAPLAEEIGEPVGHPTANDSRMNQVVLADGYLWGAINTEVNPGPRDGIQYFIVSPSTTGGGLVAGSIHKQGYVSGVGSFLSFPSIGVTDEGLGIIAFTLMGPNYFPSAAQISINPSGTTGSIRIVRDGFRPEDGFSCFAEFGSGPQCRWGDYSASVGTPDGTVFSAVEMISDNSRSYFANWSTFIWPETSFGK
jgi:hypothetical protein